MTLTAIAIAMVFALIPQERTAASAQQFLDEAFSRNVRLNHNYDVLDYQPNGCTARIFIRQAYRGGDSEVIVDYSNLSNIATNYSSGIAVVYVPVVVDGGDYADLTVTFGSDELRSRAVTAMLFLRDQCDSSRSTGF